MVSITIDFMKTILQKIKNEFKKYVSIDSNEKVKCVEIATVEDLPNQFHGFVYLTDLQSNLNPPNLPTYFGYADVVTMVPNRGYNIKYIKYTYMFITAPPPNGKVFTKTFERAYIYSGSDSMTKSEWKCLENNISYLEEHAIQDTNT